MSQDVALLGDGPHFLPVTQHVSAEANKGNGVTMAMTGIYDKTPDGKQQFIATVRTQMLPKVARELAAALLKAAKDAEAPHTGEDE